MEMTVWFYYIVFNSVVLLPYMVAKPFSLNDVIKTEDLKSSVDPNSLLSDSLKQGKKVSSLKYKNIYKIKSPLKPKKIKYLQRPRNKRRNQTTKRDYYRYAPINQKYIPILKNLGLLFDNILGSDSSDNEYTSRNEDYDYIERRKGFVCECENKSEPDTTTSQKKTLIVTRTVATDSTPKVPTIATTPTYNFTNDNFRSIKRNKNVPLLLARDTTGFRRNNNGFSKGSGPAYNRSIEGYVTRTNGDNERNPRNRKHKPNTEINEEDTNSDSRNNASSNRSDDRSGNTKYRITNGDGRRDINTDQLVFTANETTKNDTRKIFKHQGEVEFENEDTETKDTEIFPEFTPRQQGFEDSDKHKPVKTEETDEDRIFEITFNNTSHKRFSNRDGQNTSENKKFRGTNEAVVTTNVSINTADPAEKFVMIFDGYSVAKDVNGRNTLTEKSITIKS